MRRDGREPIALPTSPGGVDATAFLPDGRVAVTDVHGRLRIYDADRSAVVADLELPTRVRLLRPSPDGARLVTIPSFAGKTALPLLWDLKRYQRIAELNDHVGQVFSARFVDGSREILTAGDDGVARLWDSGTGRLLSSYRSTSRFLADAAIASDGSMIMAGGSDGALWCWDRATTRPLWRLQAHRSHTVGVHLEGDALVTRGFGGGGSAVDLPEPGTSHRGSAPRSLIATGDVRVIVIWMKKTPIKLKLRRETLRALASQDLLRAVGGDQAALADTGAKMCTDQAVPKPPPG